MHDVAGIPCSDDTRWTYKVGVPKVKVEVATSPNPPINEEFGFLFDVTVTVEGVDNSKIETRQEDRIKLDSMGYVQRK